MTALLYFLAGIIFDFLLTFYYRAVYLNHKGPATALSIAITFVSVYIVSTIVDERRGKRFLLITAYAVGNGIGTLLALLF